MGWHKYNAKKTTVNGITFDSKAEARRYSELKLLVQAGEINGLILHPTFELQPPFVDVDGKRQRAIKYVADFQYTENGRPIVEDVKGVETPVFRLKMKMFKYIYSEYELRLVK